MSALFGALLIVCASRSEVVAASTPSPRPNILLVLTDDQRWDTLSYMPLTLTAIAKRGVTFDNAFFSTPLCAPSRATLLTGQYAHHHLVESNEAPAGGAAVFNDQATLATTLQSAGYYTGLIGKYLNGYDSLWSMGSAPYIPPGWSEWHAFKAPSYGSYYLVEGGREKYYSTYSTDLLCSKALTYIATAPQPWFLWLGLYAPHSPSTPAARHVGSFTDVPPYRPPSFDLSLAITVDPARIAALKSLLAVDECVNQLVAALDSGGELAHTAVWYWSDNGYHNGEHGLYTKDSPYEEAIRAASLLRYDPLITSSHEMALVSNVDFAPTILDLAGLLPAGDGVSVLRLFTSTPADWRADVLTEGWYDGSRTWASVRSGDWKYTERATAGRELFDLVNDPYELKNLSSDPGQTGRMSTMAARLSVLLGTEHSKCIDATNDCHPLDTDP